MPVLPLPALQCTATTFFGSASSHCLALSQKGCTQISGAGLWSKQPCCSTRSLGRPRIEASYFFSMHRLYTLQWPAWYFSMKARTWLAGLRKTASVPLEGKPIAIMRGVM